MAWTRTARDQHGIISRRQLLGAGLSRHQIDARLKAGRLVRTHLPGVLQVNGSPVDSLSLTWTMALACRSPVSFSTAAQVWKLPVDRDGLVHVTRPDRCRYTTHRLLRVHRCALGRDAVTVHRGLPVTTRSETLLDCLGSLPLSSAQSLLDRSFQQRWLTPETILGRLNEQPGRWGNQQLRLMLEHSDPGAEAKSERLMAAILRGAGIQGWSANPWVSLNGRRFRIDIAFVERHVAIEVDGWAWHRSKERRDADLVKHNALAGAGWTVLTFSWEDVTNRPDYVLDTVLAVLNRP